MPFINRKYQGERDLEVLRKRLREIEALEEYLDDPRWRKVREIFNSFIAQQTQNMLDLCEKPGKNEVEILSSKKAAEWLCLILKTLDIEIGKAANLRNEIKHKEREETQELVSDPLI